MRRKNIGSIGTEEQKEDRTWKGKEKASYTSKKSERYPTGGRGKS